MVGQYPNAPLWAMIAGAIASLIFSEGSTAHDAAQTLLYMALTVWAYLELTDGVNGFRRLLGAGGLILAAVRLIDLIG